MPIYEYLCEHCKQIFEKFEIMQNSQNDQECPDCSGVGKRIISQCSTDLKENPRWSKALGVHPKQVASGEAYKVHPGATFNSKNGDMLISSRKEKLKRCAERGLTELD